MKNRTPLLLLAALLLSVSARAAVHLDVERVSARPGGSVEIPVRITTDAERLGAVVFAVAFDSSRLGFDGAAKDGDRLQNVSIDLPSGYRASASVMPANGQDAVAISFWAAPGAAVSLSSSTVRLRFHATPDASGTAWVRILPGASASSASGTLIPIESSEGGAVFEASLPFVSVNPGVIDFGHLERGTSRTIGVRLTNSGSGEAVIESVAGAEDGLSTGLTLPLTIAAGATVVVPVTFEASRDGRHQWAVIFGGNAPPVVMAANATAGLVSGDTPPTRRWIVPAVVRKTGPEESWTTSLSIHASTTAAPETVLTYFGGDEPRSRSLDLQTLETITIDDLMAWISPAAEGTGHVIVESTSPDLQLRSFAVRNGEGGAIDLTPVPVFRWTRIGGTDQSVLLGHSRPAARIELGVINTEAQPLSITIQILDARGTPLEIRSLEIAPYSTSRLEEITTEAAVARAHTEANGSFVLWASVLLEDGSAFFDVAD